MARPTPTYQSRNLISLVKTPGLPVEAAKALITESIVNIVHWGGRCTDVDDGGRSLSDILVEAAKEASAVDAAEALKWVVRDISRQLTEASQPNEDGECDWDRIEAVQAAATETLRTWVEKEARVGVLAKGVAVDPRLFAPFAEELVSRSPKNSTFYAAALEEWELTPAMAEQLLDAKPKTAIRVAQVAPVEAILGEEDEWAELTHRLRQAVMADRSWRRPIILAKLWQAGGPGRILNLLFGGDASNLDADALTTLVEAVYVDDHHIQERCDIIDDIIEGGRFGEIDRLGPYINPKRVYYTILKNPTSGRAAEAVRNLAAEAPYPDDTKPLWQRELNSNFPGQEGREWYDNLQRQTLETLQKAVAGKPEAVTVEDNPTLVTHFQSLEREWRPVEDFLWTVRRAEWRYALGWLEAITADEGGEVDAPELEIVSRDLGGPTAHQQARGKTWGWKPAKPPLHITLYSYNTQTDPQADVAVENCGTDEEAWRSLFETLESTGLTVDVACSLLV